MSVSSRNKLEHVYSKRGKKLILFSRYLFYKDREVSIGLKWRCNRKLCKAKLYTDISGTEIIKYELHHNHEPSNNINRQIISSAVRMKALENLAEEPSKIMEEALSSIQGIGDINSCDRMYIHRNMLRELLRNKVKRKREKSGTSEQTTGDQNEIEMECSDNAEMDTQGSSSATLLNSSDIVFKQEIIETELESSIFDDSSVHSSIAGGSSETHYGRLTPSSSYVPHLESSNSKGDDLPYTQTSAPNKSHSLRAVKKESDVSTEPCGEISENDYPFCNQPSLYSVSNVTDFENSPICEPIHPNLPHPISSISALVNSLSYEPMESYHMGSQPLPQNLDSSSHGSFCNNESIQPEVSTESYGEISENNDTFCNSPSYHSVSNVTDFETSSEYVPKCSKLSPPIINISDSESSQSYEPIQTIVSRHTGSPVLHQVIDGTSNESSCNSESKQSISNERSCNSESKQSISYERSCNSESKQSISNERSCNSESKQSEVLSNPSSPFSPKDRFDIFGEFIALKLRNMDSKSSAFIQSAFADLIYKAELGILLNKCESYSSTTLTDDTRKEASPINKTTNSSSEHGNTQFRVSSNAADQSIPPNKTNSCDKNSFLNEPIQHKITSHTAHSSPPAVNISASKNASKANPNQTKVSSQVGLPSSFPALNPPPSPGCNLPDQTRVPLHLRPRDEFDGFGEFAASKLRNLDSRSCAFLQTAFADLVFEAELGRFLSEGERSIFAKKTNDILRSMPPHNDSVICI